MKLAEKSDSGVQPGPPADPYCTLPAVVFLDEKLSILDARLAKLTQHASKIDGLTAPQRASLELIPASSSLAKSIRHLIKAGYLLSALVLFRPLMERVATLSYLIENADAVSLWEAGWPHGQRPSLRARLETLIPGAGEAFLSGTAAAVTKYNSFVHGDPAAVQQSLIQVSDSRIVYTSDKDYSTPGRANSIALETAIAVVFLVVKTDQLFP